MTRILISLIFAVTVSGCSAPKPPQISLTKNLRPVNFNAVTTNRHKVILSEQRQSGWRRQFTYSINTQNHSPEFFYAVAHADQIIAKIKPPFIDFVFNKLQSDLKSYGITTPVELLMTEDERQQSQVILDCIKFREVP